MKHKVFTVITLVQLLLLVTLLATGRVAVQAKSGEIESRKKVVSSLMLTDYALWTEARYARHPSQSDMFTAFQDFPGAIDHFPAGSLAAFPESLRSDTKLEIK